jgi:hypothetical protein
MANLLLSIGFFNLRMPVVADHLSTKLAGRHQPEGLPHVCSNAQTANPAKTTINPQQRAASNRLERQSL